MLYLSLFFVNGVSDQRILGDWNEIWTLLPPWKPTKTFLDNNLFVKGLIKNIGAGDGDSIHLLAKIGHIRPNTFA